MAEYTTFTTAYRPENLNKEPRVSEDVPLDFGQWRQIVENTPVIVLYMWSENCRPCLLIRDKYESLAREFSSSPHVKFYKDNIDKPTSFHRGSVEVVPTFFILCDGKEVDHPKFKSRFSGWTDQIRDSIEHNLRQSVRAAQTPPPRFVCKNNVCYIQSDE